MPSPTTSAINVSMSTPPGGLAITAAAPRTLTSDFPRAGGGFTL